MSIFSGLKMLKCRQTCSKTVHNRMKLPGYTVINGKGAVKMFQTVFKRYEKNILLTAGSMRSLKIT